jgi:addiction module HigA family antidote
MAHLKPVTPGELLREEFLVPMGLTRYRVAKEIGVPAQRLGEIVAGRRAITADTDLRLCRFFGLSNGYWLRAQVEYDTGGGCEGSRRRTTPHQALGRHCGVGTPQGG